MKIKNVFAFLCGAGVTGAALYLARKKKLKVVHEEVPASDEIVVFNEIDYTEIPDVPEIEPEEQEEPDDEEVDYVQNPLEAALLKPDIVELMHSDPSHLSVYPPKEIHPPYMISASEFGLTSIDMDEELETEALIYHADGVLLDEAGIRIDNPVDVIGQEALSRLIGCNSVFDDDAVMWVRNEKYRTDYEISWDGEPYDKR